MKNQTPTQEKSNNPSPDDEIIDETLEETFPASDSPSWYAGKDIEPRKK